MPGVKPGRDSGTLTKHEVLMVLRVLGREHDEHDEQEGFPWYIAGVLILSLLTGDAPDSGFPNLTPASSTSVL